MGSPFLRLEQIELDLAQNEFVSEQIKFDLAQIEFDLAQNEFVSEQIKFDLARIESIDTVEEG
jgi:hypothetical protein